jgi:hypothetical protein
MNDLAKEVLDGALEKFKKMEMYESMGEKAKSIEILQSFENDEINILESIGNSYLELVAIIKEAISESVLKEEEK